MTAKQAIKARCRDCLAGARVCEFTDCALKGLMGKQGRADRTTAIRKYCQWCMNGNQVSQCASPDCAIYQYRASCEGTLKVSFKPVNTPTIDEISTSKSKDVKLHGKAKEDAQMKEGF